MPQITWDQLPKEIQEKMLEHQEEQTGKRDAEVFKCLVSADKKQGGMTWDCAPEDFGFWDAIINDGVIEHFYRRYPKE